MRIWSPEEGRKFKPLHMHPSQTPESMAPGPSASLMRQRERSKSSVKQWLKAKTPEWSHKRPRTSQSSTGEDTSGLLRRSIDLRGETCESSSSRDRQEPGSRRSYTTRSDTLTYTLSQAKAHLSGSGRTVDKGFSSLTSIRAALNAKRSLKSWTDILSKLQSKVDLSGLAGMLSSSRQTMIQRPRGMLHCDEDLSQEEDSGSSELEESTAIWLDSSEERSGSEEEYLNNWRQWDERQPDRWSPSLEDSEL